ncbi:hypothetical protein [Limosilactobacillus fastidiosus]|nr:hypothetical protein [Limosilactobacillus fastidiosus]
MKDSDISDISDINDIQKEIIINNDSHQCWQFDGDENHKENLEE